MDIEARVRGSQFLLRGPGLVLVVALLSPATCLADLGLGLISFDNLVPGGPGPGVNAFSITNLTGDPSSGGFDLPPDFPVLTPLTFLASTLTLYESASTFVVALGDIGIGPFPTPTSLQFPDTVSFDSAVFNATLGKTHLLLADGSTFVVNSSSVVIALLPSSGSFLAPGTDLAVISVTGSVPSEVTEPSSFVLMNLTLIAALRVARSTGGFGTGNQP